MVLLRVSPLCVYAAIASWFSQASFLSVRKSSVESQNASSGRIHSQKLLARKLSSQPSQANNTVLDLHATQNMTNQSQQEQGGVVHFLFLVTSHIPHADIWSQFFASAPWGSWTASVHCKNSQDCHHYGLFRDNPGFVEVTTTPTYYCSDLVTAMKVLLQNALLSRAPGLRHEKFVFVSESTLPVKPFWEVSRVLWADDNSDFCVFPSDQWASATINGTYRKLVKHHQWVTLNREHAQLFVDSWQPVDENRHWPVYTRDNKKGPPTQTTSSNYFTYPSHSSSRCTDEYAFFAIIYGALQNTSHRSLTRFGGGPLRMDNHVTQGVCRTWSFWDQHWDAAATTLAGQIKNDWGSHITCYPKCWSRPAELEALTDGALHYLRHSPFLFARKFSVALHMPNYFDLVLTY